MRTSIIALTAAALLAPAAVASAAGPAGPAGRLYVSSERTGSDNNDLWSFAPDGSDPRHLTTDAGIDHDPVVSPDGTRLLFCSAPVGGSGYDLYALDLARGGKPRLMTPQPGTQCQADWSPDGSRIAFAEMNAIYTMAADGSDVRRLIGGPEAYQGPQYSPDGRRIAYTSSRGGEGMDVWVMDADGTNPRNLTRYPSVDENPSWSPAGDAIAFDSTRGPGGQDIFLMRPDGSHVVRVTRTAKPAGNHLPVFSPDGRRIAYSSNRSDGVSGTSDVFSITTDGKDERNLTREPGVGHVPSSPEAPTIAGDDAGSWDVDRSKPASAAAATTFPPDDEDLRMRSEVRVRATSGKVEAAVAERYSFGTLASACDGRVTVRVLKGKRVLRRATRKVKPTSGRECLARFTLRTRGATKVTAVYAGGTKLRPAKATERL